MLHSLNLHSRARAAAIHLLISVAVALLAAGLVFGLWYPGIYRELAGGRELFWLVVTVDVVLGPLLTFTVFNVDKGWPHLRRDLAVIALLQVAALVYGLQAVHGARPVATVFEVDRFRVITAAQVNLPELPKARPEYQRLPLDGPWLLGSREPMGADETSDAIFTALRAGIDRAQRPQFWQPYADSVPEVLRKARPLAVLVNKHPELQAEVSAALKTVQTTEAAVKFLPVMARGGDWVVMLDAQANPIGYLRADGFF